MMNIVSDLCRLQTCHLAFHHLFVFTDANAPVVDLLVSRGFLEGSSNTHSGQGTSNRRIFFSNGMLEFIWVSNKQEVRTQTTAPTHLYERSLWVQTEYSPFGICVFSTDEGIKGRDIFDGWNYRPTYLPDNYEIWMARQDSPKEPGIFHLAGPGPISAEAPVSEPTMHPNGARKLKQITIAIAAEKQMPSQALTKVLEIETLRFSAGLQPAALIEIETCGALEKIDLKNGCPISISLT
jgi:hypothetical protein